MKYIVSLIDRVTVEAKNKQEAARIAASELSSLLKGETGKPAHLYCLTDVYNGIEGQGQNDVEVSDLALKRAHLTSENRKEE